MFAARAQWIEVLAQSQCVSQLAIIHAVVMTVGMIARVCVRAFSGHIFISGKTLPLNFRHPTQHADGRFDCMVARVNFSRPYNRLLFSE